MECGARVDYCHLRALAPLVLCGFGVIRSVGESHVSEDYTANIRVWIAFDGKNEHKRLVLRP